MDHTKHIRITPTFRTYTALPRLNVEIRRIDSYEAAFAPRDVRDEYLMHLACEVKFVANSAELPHAKKNALVHLSRYLYADVLRALDEIQACLYAGDLKTGHEVCASLKTEINNFAEDTLRQEKEYETR